MKKYSIKFLGMILAVAMVVFSFAGCSGSSESQAPTPSSTTSSNEAPNPTPESTVAASPKELSGTVTFLSGETDDPQVTVHKQIIADFEKLYPNVKVDFVLSGLDDREEKILADLYAGAPVDIIQVDSESIGTYANANVLLPLDDLISSIGENDFMDGSRIILNGHDYGMPYSGCSMMMYVRTDLFKDAGLEYPKTWDDLLACAKKLTTGKQYGIVLPAGQNAATTLWLQMFINMAGGNVFNEELEPTLNTPEVIKALTLYRDLAQYAPSGITSYGYGEQISSFASGQVAMTMYQGRVIARMATDAPTLDDKYAIIPVPTTGNLNIQFGSYTYYSIGANCEHPDLAKEFLKFLTTGQNALNVAMSAPGHITPALRSVSGMVDSYNDDFVKSHLDKIKFSFDHASGVTFNEAANAGGVKGASFERNGILNVKYGYVRQNNILSKMVQRVIINKDDPAAVCADAQKELEDVIKQNK